MPERILFTILRTLLAYLLLLLMTRLMGRKTIAQMTFFDFAVAMTIGSVASDIAEAGDNTTLGTSIALVTFAILGIITAYVTLKNNRLAKLINSEPLVLIEAGQIVEGNLKRSKVTLNDLTALLREQSVFNMADVHFAVIENDGSLSILLKGDRRPVTPVDMQLQVPDEGLCSELILDGRLMEENLKAASVSQTWLYEELKKLGISDVKNVFFASIDSAGRLYVSRKHQKSEMPGEHGIE